MKKLKFIFVGMPLALILTLVAFPWTASAKSNPPVPPVPPNGLTAYINATSGQTITGFINATGKDIGVYIGPGVKNVKVKDATIFGANYEGILVQDTSNIDITDNTISNNGIHSLYLLDPTKPASVPPDTTNPQVITEGKAIELVGITNCLIKNNTVYNNNGDGGIGISDDGPFNPALPILGTPPAPNATGASLIASTGNQIIGNTVVDNFGGCGIVIAAYNNEVANNTVSDDTLIGGVGGIVIAADSPNTKATNNIVRDNNVTGSLIMGVIVHSNSPGDVVSGTKVIGNTLSNDGSEGPPYDPTSPTGIAVVSEKPGTGGSVLTNTQVQSNTISNEIYGVWVFNAVATNITNLHTSSVTTPTSIKP